MAGQCGLRRSGENTLAMWVRKTLRRTFGRVKENGVWRIRSDQGLINLYRERDIISEIRKGRSRGLKHVEIMRRKNCEKGV